MCPRADFALIEWQRLHGVGDDVAYSWSLSAWSPSVWMPAVWLVDILAGTREVFLVAKEPQEVDEGILCG
jgi:hypothetical protein